MSPLMKEAIEREDWELLDKGLPPRPKQKIMKPEPSQPEVQNEIKLSDIPLDRFDKVDTCNQRAIRNKEGFNFVGFDIIISLKPVSKRGPGRPALSDKERVEPTSISGWISEAEFNKLWVSKLRNRASAHLTKEASGSVKTSD